MQIASVNKILYKPIKNVIVIGMNGKPKCKWGLIGSRVQSDPCADRLLFDKVCTVIKAKLVIMK
jgi:hypothetical protein